MATLIRREPYLHIPTNSRFLSASEPRPEGRVAVFLDRDGVIVEDVHFLTSVESMRLLPGVVEGLGTLQRRFHLVVVSNQSGVARGFITEQELQEIHSELVRRLDDQGVILDALYYCPHLPEGTVAAYQQECECRKPKPGMILRAMRDWDLTAEGSFMVGDSPRDVEAGRRAGVESLLLGQESAGAQYGSLGDVVNLMLPPEQRAAAADTVGSPIKEGPHEALGGERI